MSQITPFTYAVVQNLQAQERAVTEKERQIRRAQAQEKDLAAQDEALDHQVESSEEIRPVNEDEHDQTDPRRRRKSRRPPADDDHDVKHIDLKA